MPELTVSLRQNKNLSEVDVVNATALAENGTIYLKLTVDTAASALLLQVNEETTQRWQVGTAAVNCSRTVHHLNSPGLNVILLTTNLTYRCERKS